MNTSRYADLKSRKFSGVIWKRGNKFTMSERMPVIFVGHGSPLNAIENNKYTAAWSGIAEKIERKQAAISGISPGMSGTGLAQDHVVTLLSFLNMKVMNAPRLVIPNARQQLNQEGRLELTVSAPYLMKQANAFVDFIRNSK